MSLDFVNFSITNDSSGDGAETNPVVRCGYIEAIHVDYHGSADAGTDVIIDVPGQGLQSVTVLTLTNNKTDGWWYPRGLACDATGGAHSPEQIAKVAFFGNIRATVDEAGATPYETKITVFFSY